MFSKKTIEAYRSVTAPSSLKSRVISMDETVIAPKKTPVLRYKTAAALAGLVIAVTISVTLFGSLRSPELLTADSKIGENPVAVTSSDNLSKNAVSPSSSSEPLSFEFFLSCTGETEISVSVGYITSQSGEKHGNSLSFDGDAQFFWVADTKATDKGASMYLTKGNKTTTYELSQNKQTAIWSISKTK